MNQRGLPAFAREQRLHQFEVPHRSAIQHHMFAAFKVGWRAQMAERGALSVAQIMQGGAGGGRSERLIAESASIERVQPEIFENLPSGIIGAENPWLERRLQARSAQAFAIGEQQFANV